MPGGRADPFEGRGISSDGGLYAADTLASFSESLGREVSANDMTSAIDKLVAANLIVRKGHGNFEIADPFVKQVWLRHVQMRQSLSGGSAGQGTGATLDV